MTSADDRHETRPWGQRLREWRQEVKHWSRAELRDNVVATAYRLGETRGQKLDERLITRWETGAVLRPQSVYCRLLAHLGAPLPPPPEESLGAPSNVDTGRVIQALDVVGSDRLGGIADSLGDLVDHYAQTICVLPPADVYDELLSVRSYAGGIIEHLGLAGRRTDIVLATGWLSNLLAVTACDMGEHAAARVWCSDAERRSHDARHPELAAWAVFTRAIIAFYQGQPRHSVTLAAQGQKIVPIGTVIHAKLASHEMRAAAMVGDASRVVDARRYAARAIAVLPSDAKMTGAFSINLGEDPPYTATSLLFVGNFDEAVSATNRVIQGVYHPETRQRGENPSGYARSLLILGLAQAGVGRLDEAVAAGHAALSGSRPAWPTMVLAGKLDQVLARDYADARETAAYHDRYLETASKPAGYHLQLPAPTEDRR